ncbi:MAG: hypothetical protein GQ477_03395 [Nanohaloarchaea archaeon]|nr:hypothetical protein [Candidatus Nanohaloarchaea archaeon]
MTRKKGKAKESEFSGMSLDGLQDKKKEIKDFLASLENDYRNATISEKSYKHTKEINLKKMIDVKKQLEDFGITDTDDESDSSSSTGGDKSTTAAPGATATDATSGDNASVNNVPVDNVPVAEGSVGNASVDPVESSSQSTNNQQEDKSSEVSDALLNEDTKHLSIADKLKQFVALSNAVAEQKAKNTSSGPAGASGSSVPSQPVQTVQASQTSQASSAPAQNVEMLMQKFSEKINVDLERIKANIDSSKDMRASTDEKVQTVMEGLTELRTTVFQREAGLKEQELKFTRVKELVDDIEPEKINKEFMKRDKFMSEMEIRIEKLEVKMEDFIKAIKHTEGLLKSIGGLENVAEIDHKVAKKLEQIIETEKSMEHLSSKMEKMFISINQKLEDFDTYEARQENMNEIMDDMLKNVDQLGVKFENYIDKKDMIKVQDNVDSLSEKIELMMGILKKAVPFAEAEIPKELQELEEKREDIESILSTLEHEHNKKQIADKDYKSIKKKNEVVLDKVKSDINKFMKKMSKDAAHNVSSGPKQKRDTKEPIKDTTNKTDVDVESPHDNTVSEENEKESDEIKSEAVKSEDVESEAVKSDDVKSDESNKDENEQESEPSKNESSTAAEKIIERPKVENVDVNDPLIVELEESLAQGLISQDTYEKTKKLITG